MWTMPKGFTLVNLDEDPSFCFSTSPPPPILAAIPRTGLDRLWGRNESQAWPGSPEWGASGSGLSCYSGVSGLLSPSAH